MMEIDAVPDQLVIAGASYVGLEFAQMYARFEPARWSSCTSENPTLGARSTLRWVFRGDKATTAQLSLQHWSADGFVDVELVNLTTGVTLVDYESAVSFGQDHISDIPIAAGNRYDLRIRIGEFHRQDGDETQVFFDFGSPVTFVSSALPGGRKRAICNRM
jgi:hypothetical protein